MVYKCKKLYTFMKNKVICHMAASMLSIRNITIYCNNLVRALTITMFCQFTFLLNHVILYSDAVTVVLSNMMKVFVDMETIPVSEVNRPYFIYEIFKKIVCFWLFIICIFGFPLIKCQGDYKRNVSII